MYGEDIIKEIAADYSIPKDAEDRLIRIVKELETEYEVLRENYEFYHNITHSLINMTEQIRNLKFKDDKSGEIQQLLNRICDSLIAIKDSESQKYVNEYLCQPDKRRAFDDEIL